MRVLMIVGGGVAAFKALETARLLMKAGVAVESALTRAATEFVTPLSFASLTGNKAHTELFELTAEVEMGHIELSRSADLLLVAPATADLMAKMAAGLATDLATTLLLATDKPVLIAPAMNVRMWTHAATQRNLATLRADGVGVVGPDDGEMACGEFGPGRLASPEAIVAATLERLRPKRRLDGVRALVTSGPTREAIDPVRYLSNHSSGRQGVAIAEALAALGAEVAFVTGPAEQRRPRGRGIRVVDVESAREMRDAALDALPADVAIFAAAVADWRPADAAAEKAKKTEGGAPPAIALVENPDILKEIAHLPPERRPALVIGFAAETERVAEHARAKRLRKGCDWLLANDVSAASGVMGGAENEILFLDGEAEARWPRTGKAAVAERLAAAIADRLRPAS